MDFGFELEDRQGGVGALWKRRGSILVISKAGVQLFGLILLIRAYPNCVVLISLTINARQMRIHNK